jgi:dienelactone hydrolase
MELRRALCEGGWRVHPWNCGWNLGARADTVERLKSCLDSISPDRPVLVVGWSLGGVFARELARAHPDRVSAVVSLGSPFSGDPRLNNVWRLYEWVAGHPVDSPPIERIPDKPPVPTLAIWSRADGIVSPRAARGLAHESDKTVEFACNHMAFGVSRSIARKVVQEIDNFLKSAAT